MRVPLFLTVVSLVSMGILRPARADGPVVRWSLVAEPAGCDGGRFARAIELACDALGHACVLAEQPEGADRRATLRCASDTRWQLEVRDASGALRWALPVDADDDGVHHAAILLARTENDAAKEAPPVATPRSELEPPSMTAAETPSPALAKERAGDRPAGAEPRAPWGLAARVRTLVGTGFGPALGGDVGAAFLVVRELSAGFDLGGEHGLSAPSGFAYSAVRLGATVGYGAPWGPSRFGAALGAGAVLGDVEAPATYTPSSQQFLHAYGRASAIVQWDGSHALRPFLALSVVASSAAARVATGSNEVSAIPWAAACIDLGLAWRSQ